MGAVRAMTKHVRRHPCRMRQSKQRLSRGIRQGPAARVVDHDRTCLAGCARSLREQRCERYTDWNKERPPGHNRQTTVAPLQTRVNNPGRHSRLINLAPAPVAGVVSQNAIRRGST
jgi:hypothetical protein